MEFIAGMIAGAALTLAALMMIGSIEWETTYEVERDDERNCDRR